MRFLSLYKHGKDSSELPSPERMAELGKLCEEQMKSGALLSTEGCYGSEKGARVRITKGKCTVTDGPFTEAKELIGGFAILHAKSKAEAIELTKNFLNVMGEGECELRQLHEQSDFAPQA